MVLGIVGLEDAIVLEEEERESDGGEGVLSLLMIRPSEAWKG